MIPIWFGSAGRRLAGFIHEPFEHCRGGAIICPPFGYEATCAYRTLRELANRLAQDGILALRFDYYGTGGSSGQDDERDIVAQWRESVMDAIEELRRRGIRKPALIGLRLGASLAYSAATYDAECAPVVLWAPISSGRRYLRELRALAAVTPGGQSAGPELHVTGHIVPRGLAELPGWSDGAIRSDVLVIRTPGEPGTVPGMQLLEIPGTAAVLERSAEEAVVPVEILDAICGWLGDRMDAPSQLRQTKEQSPECLVAPDIIEEFVRVGPFGLHGVTVRHADLSTGCGIIFLNNGAAPAAGPGRAWVEFSRVLAEDGVTSLRLDFTGLGDSPGIDRHQGKRPDPNPSTAGLETVAAVEFLRGRGLSEIVVVGLCSGAQIAVRTAAYASGIDRVLAINAPLFYLPEIGVGPPIRRLWKLTVPAMGRGRIRRLMRLPESAWTALDRICLFPSPVRFLNSAANRGTNVRLVFAADDRGLLDIRARSGKALNGVLAAGRAAVDVVPGMDHSMFALVQRKEVLGILRASCRSARPATKRLLT